MFFCLEEKLGDRASPSDLYLTLTLDGISQTQDESSEAGQPKIQPMSLRAEGQPINLRLCEQSELERVRGQQRAPIQSNRASRRQQCVLRGIVIPVIPNQGQFLQCLRTFGLSQLMGEGATGI